VDNGSGPWVLQSLDALAGCEPRMVVVGASRDEVVTLLPAGAVVVDNPGYAEGMGSSLRVGLRSLTSVDDSVAAVDAAVVLLVDLPGVGREVVDRIRAAAGPSHRARTVLARAAFRGIPSHPVLLGRDHWPGVIDTATGDSGAREYLTAHPPLLVECGDIGSGEDVDRPPRG
jgi:CTP:molybdopterin cytidylyltransferase MocA